MIDREEFRFDENQFEYDINTFDREHINRHQVDGYESLWDSEIETKRENKNQSL